MDIRLIAMDLDGTALQPDRCSFSARLTEALAKAYERGIAIAPVTGRQFLMLPAAVQNHPVWENLVVLCNGGQIRNMATGEILYEKNISRAALKQLLDLSRELDIPIEFSVDSVLYLTEKSLEQQQGIGSLKFHLNTILEQHGKVVSSLDPFCEMPVEKCNLPYIPPHLHKQAERRLQDISVSAVWSSATSMEITHPDAKKGTALEQLCRLLNIPMECTMALGDSGNDESMLQTAGLGVAMGNAPDYVKAAADAVTERSENDGAAIAIERYVLNQETRRKTADNMQ